MVLSAAAFFASIGGTAALIVTRLFTPVTNWLGHPQAPWFAAAGAFGCMAASLGLHAAQLSVVATVFGEPKAASYLRMYHGVPGAVSRLGDHQPQWPRPRAVSVVESVSAVWTTDGGHFALLTSSVLGWTTLPLPASAAPPLCDALEQSITGSRSKSPST